MVKFCVLASGSAGNTSFVGTSKTRVLVDAGLSVKDLNKRLAEIGEDPDSIDAVLITHEHSDHVAGLARFVRWREKRKKPVPVYLSRLTAPLIDWSTADGKQPEMIKEKKEEGGAAKAAAKGDAKAAAGDKKAEAKPEAKAEKKK